MPETFFINREDNRWFVSDREVDLDSAGPSFPSSGAALSALARSLGPRGLAMGNPRPTAMGLVVETTQTVAGPL